MSTNSSKPSTMRTGMLIGVVLILLSALYPGLRFFGAHATATVTGSEFRTRIRTKYSSGKSYTNILYTFTTASGETVNYKTSDTVMGRVPAEGETFEVYYLENFPWHSYPDSSMILVASFAAFGMGMLILAFSILFSGRN